MRIAILGDIHGNLEALDAVLEHASHYHIDLFLSVGDIVGYGADPIPCLQRLQDLHALAVAGNHDWAAIGRLDTRYFNAFARSAIHWTQSQLLPNHRKYISHLPLHRSSPHFSLFHASPHHPERFHYIQTTDQAAAALDSLHTSPCFIGHSHLPVALARHGPSVLALDPTLVKLDSHAKWIVNVGSVGQPRDLNPAAAWALYDTDERSVRLLRVPYDIEKAAQKILSAGLPSILASRLAIGR